MSWSIVFLDDSVQAEMDALPREFRANFERITDLIRSFGLEQVHEPDIKHLEDRLWEMRLRGRDGIARAV